MSRVTLVGSGASAVHFAKTALEQGRKVLMLDVGRKSPLPINPDESFARLKETLDDPASYFLGPEFGAVLFPGDRAEYYGFPAHKSYIFSGVSQFRTKTIGFRPLSSFARGGLAEAWTGGAFPFNDGELSAYPFDLEEILPFYGRIAGRIGITGSDDDLARFYPVHENLEEALDLDEHSAALLHRYERKKQYLNTKLGCYLGRSRVATLRNDMHGRKGCGYLGRCLWGCPTESLYTPAITLRECMEHEGFEYRSGLFVSHFRFDATGRVNTVVAETVEGRQKVEIPVESLVLAAGTLSTCRIFLKSIYLDSGECPVLPGLMDNRQVLMPYVNLNMIRKQHDPETYQYHLLTMGLDNGRPEDYVHCLITTLKTTLIHPIVQSVPFDFSTSLYMFRNLHAALGLVNLNLSDERRESNSLRFEPSSGERGDRLKVTYHPSLDEPKRVGSATARVRKALRALGCVVPPGMSHLRPMGASVHYAGTLPMSAERRPLTTSRNGRSHDFDNLWIVDGAVLPSLPAKNLTFTLMANAARIAEKEFSA